jgi:hypothetical protein
VPRLVVADESVRRNTSLTVALAVTCTVHGLPVQVCALAIEVPADNSIAAVVAVHK